MPNTTLSVVGINVNDIPIATVPNSLKTRGGKGEVNVRFASTGGGGGQSVHSEDAESKIGMVSFEVYPTTENKNLVTGWKANIGSNTVNGQQPGSAPISFSHMSMTNDPDFELSADGVVEIIFEGDPESENV